MTPRQQEVLETAKRIGPKAASEYLGISINAVKATLGELRKRGIDTKGIGSRGRKRGAVNLPKPSTLSPYSLGERQDEAAIRETYLELTQPLNRGWGAVIA